MFVLFFQQLKTEIGEVQSEIEGVDQPDEGYNCYVVVFIST